MDIRATSVQTEKALLSREDIETPPGMLR